MTEIDVVSLGSKTFVAECKTWPPVPDIASLAMQQWSTVRLPDPRTAAPRHHSRFGPPEPVCRFARWTARQARQLAAAVALTVIATLIATWLTGLLSHLG